MKEFPEDPKITNNSQQNKQPETYIPLDEHDLSQQAHVKQKNEDATERNYGNKISKHSPLWKTNKGKSD